MMEDCLLFSPILVLPALFSLFLHQLMPRYSNQTPLSKLQPIASLLCENVMTFPNKIRPSYKSKMKFLQGIIVQVHLSKPDFKYIPDVPS